MDSNEYLQKKEKLRKENKEKEFALAREYALAHKTNSIGDVIEDQRCIIKISSIKISVGSMQGFPECVYFGVRLKKDLTPRKDGENTQIYQHRIKRQETK